MGFRFHVLFPVLYFMQPDFTLLNQELTFVFLCTKKDSLLHQEAAFANSVSFCLASGLRCFGT